MEELTNFIELKDVVVNQFTIDAITRGTLPANPTTPELYVLTIYLGTSTITIPYLTEEERDKDYDDIKCKLMYKR